MGGARTALFNFLFARSQEGAFLLRIEDTDRERSSEEMTRSILEALEWLGLEHDGPVVHQADRMGRHRELVDHLVEAEAAYRCFCSGSELEDRGREECPCRSLDPREARRRAEEGEEFAVRFRSPRTGRTEWDDVVHGASGVDNESVEDFVLLRSDGRPVYNMACVADDLAMEITHVIRGDDHLSNTPKQLLVYRAMDREPPAFAHVPMILGPDGKRLSKRHGAASVEAYREKGVVPEALVNFLALLGWSPGDEREIMEMPELVEAFSLDRILRKSAVFDVEKLEWLNGQYLSRLPLSRVEELVVPRLADDPSVDADLLDRESDRLREVLELVRPRPRTVEDLVEQARPFFAREVVYQEEAVERFWSEPGEAARALEAMKEVLAEVEPWAPGALEEALRERADELGVGAGALIHPLRVALTGLAVSPGIFRVIHLMGRRRCLDRVEDALARLSAEGNGA